MDRVTSVGIDRDLWDWDNCSHWGSKKRKLTTAAKRKLRKETKRRRRQAR